MIINTANTTLYQSPKISLKVDCTPCANVESDILAKADGTNMIACANIIGITPDAFSFNGMNWRAPKIFFSKPPEAVLRAYCTGIFRTAITSMIESRIITNQRTNSIRIIINPPLDSTTLDTNSCANDRSEEHTSELQSRPHLVCRLLLE